MERFCSHSVPPDRLCFDLIGGKTNPYFSHSWCPLHLIVSLGYSPLEMSQKQSVCSEAANIFLSVLESDTMSSSLTVDDGTNREIG